MYKLFKQNIQKKIKSSDLTREVGIEKDGEKITLSEADLVEYLKNLFEGGKSITQAEKQMINDGIKDRQWQRRKEIITLLEQIKTKDDNISKEA
ncbi:hypothetical protein DRH27_01440 [Candidatus Falkowbacteria bacterium]|nr:MAG: hypothetical protein DRH27_01440 [Candidatus Falkowbacteria bacterium]